MEDIKWVNSKESKAISEEDLKKLLKLLDSVQYGSITLTLQEGKVVQIEKNEKMRIK